jgi:hypothetical protein
MRRLTILIAALALVAAACGSGETSEAFVSPSTTTATTLPPSSDQSPTTAAPATTTPSDGATTTTPPSTPAVLPESDYPDVTVADLAGGELNLRELALEAEPVLLWFWAPH